MKSTVSIIALFSYLLFASFPINAATEHTATYQNQRGSTMTLTWHEETPDSGKLSGTFTTAVGKCKVAIGKAVPLTGFYNGNAVAIIVNYPSCTGVVAMTGNFTHHNTELDTIWLLARKANDPVHGNWDSNTVGSDHFRKSS